MTKQSMCPERPDRMKLFAIRHIPSGNFLPSPKTRTGGTWVEPTPHCIPRLFKTQRIVNNALTLYVQGPLMRKWERSGEFGEEQTPYTERDTSQPIRNRNDYEIVQVNLEILP